MGYKGGTKKPGGGGTTPTPTQQWSHESPGRATNITVAGALWAWRFPKAPGLVGYATRPGVTLTGKTAIRFKFRIEGEDPTWVPYHPESEGPPCKVRPYFQRRGDNGTAQHEFYRWWGNAHVTPLALGSFDLTVALDPAQWGSVLGKTGMDGAAVRPEWGAALANVSRMGFTFGGAKFAGHGAVLATGSANFILEEYTIV